MFIKQPNFRCFQCVNEDNRNKNLNYIVCGEPNNKTDYDYEDTVFTFFDRTYDIALWFSETDFHILCHLARKNIRYLEQAALQSITSYPIPNYSLIRKKICEFSLACRAIITSTNEQYEDIRNNLRSTIKSVLLNIKSLKELPDYILFNYCSNENLNQHASYNYFHLSLDMHWYSISSVYYIESNIDKFENAVIFVLKDLIYISLKKIQGLNNYTNLLENPPFLCPCLKELWLLIQLEIENLHTKEICKDFWHYFNTAAKDELNFQTNTNSKDYVACIWLVYHLTKLQGLDTDGSYIGPLHYRVVPNYTIVEQYLKCITNTNSEQIDEQLMYSCLLLLAPLQMTWWIKVSNFDLLQLMWEYFYKKINQSFSNETETFISQKSYNYSVLTDNILGYDFKYQNGVTSYDIFLSLLGNFLIKNPTYWFKLKGRIYSKLSPSKLLTLTNIGLNNLIQLFLVLAYSVNFEELINKLQSLLTQIPITKSESSTVIWSAYISIIQMRVNRKLSLKYSGSTDVCAQILLAVQTASTDRSQAHLMKMYVEGLNNIIECDKDLSCHEYILFEGWINKYVQWCSYTESCYLFGILKNLIIKMNSINASPEWWTIFETNVIPAIIQLPTISDAPSEITELASTIIIVDSIKYKNLLEFFTSDNIHVNLQINFLTSILHKNCSNLNETSQHLILLGWIRVAILSQNITEVTSLITKLPAWSNLECDTVDYTNPLLPIIKAAGNRLTASKSIYQTGELKKWCETYFGKLDRWLSPVVSNPEQEENSQIIMKIYLVAAFLYFNCSPVLYTKNKNTCILYRLTSVLLLPSSVLTNKKIPDVILSALKKTWHVYYRGIARINASNDLYISRTLKDMIIRYVPYFYEISSPIIRCLDTEFEEKPSTLVLETIANNIITCKSKHFHEHSYQALSLINAICIKQNLCEAKFIAFSNTVFSPVCEQLLFNDDNNVKTLSLNIIENIVSHNYFTQVRENLKTLLLNIVNTHLPFHAAIVFRFLESIAIHMSIELEEMYYDIKEIVKKVECMRGVGYDRSLRKGLQSLQNVIS